MGRGPKCGEIPLNADKDFWACPGEVKRRMARSRCLVGWCEFSTRLFTYFELRCSTEGITRQVITRALGAGLANPVVDQWLIPAVPGDRLMACSDGLTNEVTPELLTATLLTEPDPQVAAQTLLAAAPRAGGRDNVTVVVVDCQSVVSTAGDAVSFADTTASDTLPDEELL